MHVYRTTQITPPAVEPVTLASVKHSLGIPADMAEDDAYLMGLVAAARRLLEVRLGRAIMASKWRASVGAGLCSGRCGGDCGDYSLPAGAIRLPRWPVLYGDDYDVAVFRENDIGGLVPVDASEVTVLRLHDAVAVESGWQRGMWVEWWAGHADPREVEPTIKAAIIMVVGVFYGNRGDGTQEGDATAAWDAVQGLVMAEWDGRIYR